MSYLYRIPITRAERDTYINNKDADLLKGLSPATAKKVSGFMKRLNGECEIKVIQQIHGGAYLEIWPPGREMQVWFPTATLEKIRHIAGTLGVSDQTAVERILEYSLSSPEQLHMLETVLTHKTERRQAA